MDAGSSSDLVELVYISQASKYLSHSETIRLISSSRVWNESHEITGALFYRNGNFAQILEGSFRNISLVCERIKRDDRHHKIVQIESSPIATRRYPQYSLRFYGEAGLEKQFPNLAYAMGKGSYTSSGLLELIRNPT